MIEEEGKYYLYRHIREDKNEVFYVGIGTKKENVLGIHRITYKRAHDNVRRNCFWKSIVNKTLYKIEIICESNNRKFIEEKEVEFIKLYGRRNLNLGTLCNLTDGGERNCGYIPSKEVVEKQRQRMKGTKASEESKEKMRASKINIPKTDAKKYDAYDLQENLIFQGMTSLVLAEHIKVNRQTITSSILRKFKCKNFYIVNHKEVLDTKVFIKPKKKFKCSKKVLVESENFQKIYESLSRFAIDFNFPYSSVKQAFKANRLLYHKYKITKVL